VTHPSAMILDGYATVEIVDAEGRVLQVRKPNVLDKLRLFKAVGPDLAQNTPYLGIALVACAVTAIDGVPVPHPGSEQQIESLILRLGDAGINAAGTLVNRDPSDPEVREEAGNLVGTPI
jgi:hypothetical protein